MVVVVGFVVVVVDVVFFVVVAVDVVAGAFIVTPFTLLHDEYIFVDFPFVFTVLYVLTQV